MGTIHKFRKPPKHRGQFKGRAAKQRSRKPWKWGYKEAMLLTLGVSIGGLIGMAAIGSASKHQTGNGFQCTSAHVLDGDTFDCGGIRVRLQGIDAPELEGHCRPGRKCAPGDPNASAENLRHLLSGNTILCRQTDTDNYGRTVARCSNGQTDLSCAQIKGEYAIHRYAMIFC